MTVPSYVDARRMASTGGWVSGDIPLDGMSRLAADLASGLIASLDTAWLQLDFAEDAQRLVVVTGSVQALLPLRCQRCLNAVNRQVDASVQVMLVADDSAAAAVPRGWEPMLSADGLLAPAELAEEELILALPLIVHCSDPVCRAQFESAADAACRDSLFAALADWKRER